MPRSKVPQEDVFVGDHGSGFFVQGPHVDVGYVVLAPGDFFLCDAGVMHYLVNEDRVPWRALFIKAPHVPGDRVTSAWRPGDAAPPKAERTGG